MRYILPEYQLPASFKMAWNVFKIAFLVALILAWVALLSLLPKDEIVF